MDLNTLQPYLLHEFKSEHDLVAAIEELSLKFTKSREDIEDYLKDKRLVSAYVAFYLTTNFAKFSEVMKWVPADWQKDLKECDFIDLGAGPGTFSLAFMDWAGESFKGEIFQLEKSPLMREQAKKIWDGLYPGKNLNQNTDSKSGRNKFLFFGHSANEMGADAALDYIRRSKAEHILFIEPGTKTFFPEMLRIRKGLLADGYNILYPCPNELECPLKNSSEDWCHQFIEVSHSADVERLSQMVRKDRRRLPLTVHAYSKKSYGAHPSERLVRVLPETKFSFEWEVCVQNQLQKYQIMKRPYNKSELKNLSHVLAGASLETELEKETEQSKRVKLIRLNK